MAKRQCPQSDKEFDQWAKDKGLKLTPPKYDPKNFSPAGKVVSWKTFEKRNPGIEHNLLKYSYYTLRKKQGVLKPGQRNWLFKNAEKYKGTKVTGEVIEKAPHVIKPKAKPAVIEKPPKPLTQQQLQLDVVDEPNLPFERAITKDEAFSISRYTGLHYKEIKRAQKRNLRTHALYNDVLNIENALTKGKSYKGTVYRGLKNIDRHTINDWSKTGKVIKTDSITSFSKLKDETFPFLLPGKRPIDSQNVVFRIKNSKTGKDITKISHQKQEEEILVGKGFRFKVLSVKKLTKAKYIRRYGKQRIFNYTEIIAEQVF